MSTRPDDELAYLLDLAADDALDPSEKVRLERRLAAEPKRRREAVSARELVALLDADRQALQPPADLRREVMENLRSSAWEARHLRAWRLPVALLVVLAALAGVLLGTGAEATAGSTLAAARTVLDSIVAAVVAGAGLASASWRGLGLALGEVFAGSAVEPVLFGLAVLCFNVLVVLLVRRARRRPIGERIQGEASPR